MTTPLLLPLDLEAIEASVRKTGRCVIVHEALKSCAVGAEIAASLYERALLDLQAPIQRVTAPDIPPPLYRLEQLYIPGVEDILAARDTLKAQGARVLGTGEPKIGAHGKPVLFLHPKDFNGTLIELEQV